MRKITLLLGLAFLLPALAQAQMSEGTVKVFSVRGEVKLIDLATKKSKPLLRGMEFSDGTQGTQVVTGPKSSALLLFSNGAAVTVSENSTFVVNEFVQAEFDPAAGTFLRLTQDPSVSKTKLYLDDGTVAGQVKRLQQGSEYVVDTPTASAGIRGTDYIVKVTRAANGEVFTTITNASGTVVAIVNGNPLNVAENKSVTIKGRRTVSDTGEVTYEIEEVGEETDMTQEEIDAINETVNEINDAENQELPPVPVDPDAGDEGTTPDVDIDPDLNVSPAGG